MLFMAEPPYLLRDLVNDREIIRKNRKNKNPQPIDYTKFLILAMLKNKENIQGPYKYIPGIKKSTTLSDAKKKLNEIKINGIPILNSDYEYIPWKFELVECEKLNKKKKRKIEDMLKTLWEYYLDKEYSRIKRRMIK